MQGKKLNSLFLFVHPVYVMQFCGKNDSLHL